MLRPALVVVLFSGLSSLCTVLSAADAWQPFPRTPSGAIVVPVHVGGDRPTPFLIDTGSTRTAISASLARRLGARPVGETLVLTPSGSVKRPLAALPRIVAGASRPLAALAMIVPDADLARGIRADGILGQDVLARLVITIDYAEGRVMWGTVSAPADAITLPTQSAGGQWVIRLPRHSCTDERPECRPLELIPDSGADGIVLFRRPGAPLPFVTPLDTAAVKTVAGTRVVRRALIESADLGAVRLDGQVASIVELPSNEALTVDGLLPLHLFALVTLDGPGKRLTLVPR
jgi:predicted aspartyl protease